VERTEEGYRVWIAIADVSEYVQPDSELDREAMARGCTIYLPDRALPMLPAALAADLCSLLPDHDRLCLCVIADLDRRGMVEKFEIVEGIMRSAAMLTYGGVARALGFSDHPPRSAQAEHFKRGLKVLDELAKKLRKARLKRGALDLDLPEAQVRIDEDTGAPLSITRRTHDPGMRQAYNMVEELMLLANELVATFLSKRRCPTIYRIHGTPDEAKLERVAEVAELLSVSFDLDEMLEPRGVSKWLQRIAKHEKKQVLEMLVLRSLKQAQYDIVNIGHFGLASDNYLHFTSPIRRYPDIEVHRAVKRLLRGGKPDTSASAIEALRAAATLASLRERAALNVEREVVDLHRALLMRSHLGETLEGTVTSVVGSGLYVTLDDPFVDVLVRYEALGPDRYEAEDHELSVVGIRSGDRVMVGDRIVVTIDDVAILRRTVYARRVVPDGALRRLDGPRRGKQRGKDKRGKDQLPARASRGSERKSQGPAQASTRSPSKPSKQGKRRKRR
jgi:ribonuclease R